MSFIENVNYRAFPTTCSTCSAIEEGVAPNLKPYQQHELGVWYGLPGQHRNVAFEARYDRRRLDQSSKILRSYNPVGSEKRS